ncbi:class I SAM-dependent methyltransferase [Brasilonema octagenarum]|nr:class I SAM-dependent methyltransferase [Brasilonema octagenarum]NMF63231.1 SAM-dependent methyltransferase [Brasilonema octagenarum UFV-OR1]
MNNQPSETRNSARQFAKIYIDCGDPLGWFEALYLAANENPYVIPWADMKPNPNILAWIDKKAPSFFQGLQVLVVGCGLGDDAEKFAELGCHVVAFDISLTAIKWCQQRFPLSSVKYVAADLLKPPTEWNQSFDLVIEAYTLQVLPPDIRTSALEKIASFVRPQGRLLIVARGRDEENPPGTMPWPLTKTELSEDAVGLNAISPLEDYFDNEVPPVRRFRIEFINHNYLVETEAK